MSTNQRATRAIESYIRDEREDEIGTWRSSVPSAWGMPIGTWQGVGRRIIRIFNQLDSNGVQINPTNGSVNNAILNLHTRPLGQFHQYIVDKAEQLQMQTQLRALERRQ